MINKKILLFCSIVICLVIIFTGVNVFANRADELESIVKGYDFPVKPGTTEWNNLKGRV